MLVFATKEKYCTLHSLLFLSTWYNSLQKMKQIEKLYPGFLGRIRDAGTALRQGGSKRFECNANL